MPLSIELVKLYRRPANLWVEDALSSEYLNEVWREPRALFLIAGATDSVQPVVKDAVRRGANSVFGVIDRDFEATNFPRWANPELRHFILPVHEMENYLLDENALHACDVNNLGRTADAILIRMQARASAILYWMTACHVLKRIRRHCLDQFMPRPTPTALTTIADVLPYIQATDWYQSFAQRAAEIASPVQVQTWIDEAHQTLSADLANGNWKRTFSGKEILRDVRGYIYQPPHSAPPGVFDVDLAQSVARWQADNNIVPADLIQLLMHVRTKAGI